MNVNVPDSVRPSGLMRSAAPPGTVYGCVGPLACVSTMRQTMPPDPGAYPACPLCGSGFSAWSEARVRAVARWRADAARRKAERGGAGGGKGEGKP